MRSRMPPHVRGLIWISPWIIGFCLFMLLPVALSVYYSLCDFPLLGVPVFQGLENFERLADDGIFWRSTINTLVFALVTIPGTTVLSILLAVLLNAGARGQTIHRAIIFLPSLVPVVTVALVWMWLYNGDVGLINTALGLVGVRGPNWLTDSDWAMPALMIMTLWIIGQPVVIYLAALQDVPKPLYEASTLDGAGPVRTFFNVTVPMISPVILFNVIIATITTLQVFVVPYIMTEGGPGESTLFYSMYLYFQAFRFRDMGYASAMAWVQLVFIVLVTGSLFLIARRFVHYQGA